MNPRDTPSLRRYTPAVPRSDAAPGAPAAPALEIRSTTDLDAIRSVLDRVSAWCDASGLPAGVRRTLGVVLDDVLGNVSFYGYAGGPDLGVELRVDVGDGRLRAVVSDRGTAFDPTERSSPDTTVPLDARKMGGLGIHLVRAMMDDVRYERAGDRNVLTIIKRLEELDGLDRLDPHDRKDP